MDMVSAIRRCIVGDAGHRDRADIPAILPSDFNLNLLWILVSSPPLSSLYDKNLNCLCDPA
ncbi:hypothetical protein PROFUN_07408 [Planoprotostelium fungivorum]|uniref:Uncharacterized protein n=1 Tax=Planoprotostelium fungivorum TaxID=1890364 RepID=A0A2P6MTI1_9EUKA|nr:hypothetical protein PROFUN_07408 [Planoprotostelium fungivorum]